MRGFVATEAGWECALETWERDYLAGLFEHVAAVLALDGPTGEAGSLGEDGRARAPEHPPGGDEPQPPVDSGPAGSGRSEDVGGAVAPPDDPPTAGPPLTDEEILLRLDFEVDAGPGAPGATGAGGRGRQGGDGGGDVPADVVPLLEVLLPDSSEDPDIAVDIGSMTRSRLRSLKHERTGLVIDELLNPSGRGGAVRVRRGQEAHWLAALNDVRLVLAVRLGVDSARDAEQVHAVAWRGAPQGETPQERWRRAMALSYDMLTWWQESLLSQVLRADPPA